MPGESQETPATGRPDPSVLTTEQLLREIETVKALTAALLATVREVSTERFETIERELALIERQRVEQKKDTKDAVDAALTAQKEAVREQTTASERAIAKSEAATTKQLDQQTVTFTTAINGVTGILNDLKERVGRIENVKVGATETKSDQRLNLGALVGVATLVVLLLSTAVGLIVAAVTP